MNPYLLTIDGLTSSVSDGAIYTQPASPRTFTVNGVYPTNSTSLTVQLSLAFTTYPRVLFITSGTGPTSITVNNSVAKTPPKWSTGTILAPYQISDDITISGTVNFKATVYISPCLFEMRGRETFNATIVVLVSHVTIPPFPPPQIRMWTFFEIILFEITLLATLAIAIPAITLAITPTAAVPTTAVGQGVATCTVLSGGASVGSGVVVTSAGGGAIASATLTTTQTSLLYDVIEAGEKALLYCGTITRKR